MAYALRWYPAFNQWSPCSVSPHSAPAESCRRLCSGPVDAQRLLLLGSFLHRLSSTSGCWIEWLMPFAGIRRPTNGHRAVFHCILPRQGRVNARALARWTHSAFRAYGVPTQALFQQWLLDRMAYALRWYPAFNQWSPCSVSPHSVPAGSCKRPYSGPGCRLHRLCSSNRFQPLPQTAS